MVRFKWLSPRTHILEVTLLKTLPYTWRIVHTRLLEAEHEIQLTNIAEISVQRLHQAMDKFQDCQLILRMTGVFSQLTIAVLLTTLTDKPG